MSVVAMVVIWCDGIFETEKSYQTMLDDFNHVVSASPSKAEDPLDSLLFAEGREELRSNEVPVTTVRTIDDALAKIEENKDKRVFVICSGALGRCLVPTIHEKYPKINDIYVFAHNLDLNYHWAVKYAKILRMFDFPTSLLVRLTRDVSAHFIEQGHKCLESGHPKEALECFNHARDLKIIANTRDKRKPNTRSTEPEPSQPDFRLHLDQLEGTVGLIAETEKRLHTEEQPMEVSQRQ